MKKVLFLFLLFAGLYAYSQKPVPPIISTNLTPKGYFENVFDNYGNKYAMSDIKSENIKTTKTGTSLTNQITCVGNSYFDLYFETGSGMETVGNPVHDARRAVVCQVFTDMAAFINSPLETTGKKVNIWVRNINNVPGVPAAVLGLCTPFYNLPNNAASGFGGIADNEIWKTIHTGKDSYTNVVSPISTSGINSGVSGVFYHGIVAFNFNVNAASQPIYNWNLNRAALATSTQYDLYTVALHEVTHALGFASLVDTNGNPQFESGYKYYSRYDTFLKTSGNQNLLLNSSGCSPMYNRTFNSSFVNNLHPSTTCVANNTTCSTAIKFIGSAITNFSVPVYTPNCWETGSSLSHFEDGCYTAPSGFTSGNDLYFTMSNANGMGTNKRYLKKEERLALTDIGYSLKTTYGVSSTLQGIPPVNYYGSTNSVGISVAGINDGLNPDGTYMFLGNASTAITINSATNTTMRILTNDTGATGFECLQDVYDTSSVFSATSGTATTNITFNTATPGLHLLRYVPYNSTGKGNITYIYVFVISDTNCAVPTACNLVANGDFEQFSSIPNNTAQLEEACGWYAVNTASPSSEYFHAYSGNTRSSLPCNILGYEPSRNNVGNGYAGFATIKNYLGISGYYFTEAIGTTLASPLLPNTTYQLSFDVSLAEYDSASSMQFQAYLSPTPIYMSTFDALPVNNLNMLKTNATVSTISNGWERINFTVTTGAIAGEKYLYIGGINSAAIFQPRNAEPLGLFNCGYYSNSEQSAAWSVVYYFVDNVVLVPATVSFILPSSLCANQTLPNLNNYVTPNTTTGTFTGSTGIVYSGGTYSFNPALAPVGINTITYTYTNNNGCSIEVVSVINVVSQNMSATISGSSTACTTSPANSITTNSTTLLTGQTALWTITGGNGTISGSNNQSSVTVNWTSLPGTLQLKVTNAAGCIATTTKTVTSLCFCDCLNTMYVTTKPLLDNDYRFTVLNSNSNIICSGLNLRYIWTLSNGNVVTTTYSPVVFASQTVSVVIQHLSSTGTVLCSVTRSSSGSSNGKTFIDTAINEAVKVIVNPNPSQGLFNLFIEGYSGKLNVKVIDINGREVFTETEEHFKTEKLLDLNHLSSGIYILKVNGESINSDQKIIKN